MRNALHNWMYPDLAHRPADMHVAAQIAFLVLGGAMTFLTLWPGSSTSIRVAYGFGGLIVLMAIFSPVCHSHYLMFCLPIVMCLLAGAWQDQPTLRVPWPLASVFAVFFTTMAIAYLPGLEILKDRCASLFATLPLWGIPIARLWRRQPVASRRSRPRRARLHSGIFGTDSLAKPCFSAILMNIPRMNRGGRGMSKPIFAGNIGITTEPLEDVEITIRPIPPFNVILENDDHHSMEFVISVLQKALGYNEQKCFQLMMLAHERGQAIVWTGTKEVAELKLEQMLSFHEIQTERQKARTPRRPHRTGAGMILPACV